LKHCESFKQFDSDPICAGEQSHDWGKLLTMMHLLNHAQAIARLCFCLGVLVMLAGLAKS
jgi:hypothetical protein